MVIFYNFLRFEGMVTIKEHTQRYCEVMTELMVSNDLTDQKFADSLGVTRTLISHIRKGTQNASIDLIIATAEVYKDVNTDYILTGRGDKWVWAEVEESGIVDKLKERELQVAKLQNELREAYMEIGELRMKLKSVEEHKSSQKIG